MKDKKLSLLSTRTWNRLLYIIYNWHSSSIVLFFYMVLFLKCDVTKFRIPLPLVTQCHSSSTPSAPLMCDVIYGWPLTLICYIY